jgi:hypothetical protein
VAEKFFFLFAAEHVLDSVGDHSAVLVGEFVVEDLFEFGGGFAEEVLEDLEGVEAAVGGDGEVDFFADGEAGEGGDGFAGGFGFFGGGFGFLFGGWFGFGVAFG